MLGMRKLASWQPGLSLSAACGQTHTARWTMYMKHTRSFRSFSSHALRTPKAVQQYLSAELASPSKAGGHSGVQQLSQCLQYLTSTVAELVDDRCIAQLFRAAVLRRQHLAEGDVKCLQSVLGNLSSTAPPKQVTALASIAHSTMALLRERRVDQAVAGELLRPVLAAATAVQRHDASAPLPLRATSTLLLASSTCRTPSPRLWAALVSALPSAPTVDDLKPLCNALHAASTAGRGTRNSAAFDTAYIALARTAAAAVHTVPAQSWPLHSTVAMAASLLRPPPGHAVTPPAADAADALLHAADERQQEAAPALLVRAAAAECRLVRHALPCGGAGPPARPLMAAAAGAAAAMSTQRDAAHLAAVLLHEGAQSCGVHDSAAVVAALRPLRAALPGLLRCMSRRDLPLAVQALQQLSFLHAPQHCVQDMATAAVAAMSGAQPPLSPASVLFCVRALAPEAPLGSLVPLTQALQRVQQELGDATPISQQLLLLHCASVLCLSPDECQWLGGLGDSLARGVREENKSPEQRTPRGVSAMELLAAAEGLLSAQQQRAAARLMRAATAGARAPLGAALLPPPKAPVLALSAEMLAHATGALAASLPSDARLMAACTARALQAVGGGSRGGNPPSHAHAEAAAGALSPRAVGDLVLGMCVTGTLAGRLRVSAHETAQPAAQAVLARWLQLQRTTSTTDPARRALQTALGVHAERVAPQDWHAVACSALRDLGLFRAARDDGEDAVDNKARQSGMYGMHSVATGDVLPICLPHAKVGVFFVGAEDCSSPSGAQGRLVRDAQRRLLQDEHWSTEQQIAWLRAQLVELEGAGALRVHSSLQLALQNAPQAEGSGSDSAQPALVFLQDAAPAHPRAVARLAALHALGWALLPVSCWEVAAAHNAGQLTELAAGMRRELRSMAHMGEIGRL